MEEIRSPGSAKKKLKQAQLPFMVLNNKSNLTPQSDKKAKTIETISFLSSDENEDKENISTPASIETNNKSNDVKTNEPEEMVIDLTCENSCDAHPSSPKNTESSESKMPLVTIQHINEAIDTVVRRFSAEFIPSGDGIVTPKESASAKKRRRRSASLSPLPPDAKRLNPTPTEESFVTPSKTASKASEKEKALSNEVPEIVITAATPPVAKPKNPASTDGPLKSFLEKLMSQEKETSETKKHHAPLAAVLPKKRPRSRSPSPSRAYIQGVKKENRTSESVEIDLTKSTTPSKKSKQGDIEEETTKHVIPVKQEIEKISIKEEELKPAESCQSPPPASTSMDSSQLETPSPPEKSGSGSKITPKSGSKSVRSLEAQRKKEEREKEREEKRKQKEEQRLAKEKEKLDLKRKRDEEKAQKEEERKKKKEEEELLKAEKQRKLEEKRKEKEKLELEKKMEREKKEEEKRKEKEKREDEKRQKEEEKRQKEEERLQAEEEKRRKKEKRAEAFKSFFKSPARSPSTKKQSPEPTGMFIPFQLKKNMMLAPVSRRKMDSAQKRYLDNALEEQNFTSSYFKQFRGNYRRARPMPTLPKLRRQLVSLSEDGLELVEDGESKPGAKILRAKFLLFHTNYRPPYYGTWRKESKTLSYKNPFKKDTDLFDYEFESDDEWEDPGEGEDIDKSDDEDEEEKADEDEDDGFFVPHGYLSDDEGINEEAEDDGPRPDHKLKQKQLEFEASFKRKLSALTPVIIGCVWKDSKDAVDKVHRDILSSYKAEILCSTPIQIHPPNKKNADKTSESPTDNGKTDKAKKYGLKAVPDEAMHDLIRLLHGNPLSLAKLSQEFRVYWKLKNAEGEETSYGPISLDENDDNTEMDENMEPMEISPTKDLSVKIATAMEVDITPTTSGRTSPADDKITSTENTPSAINSTPKTGDSKDHEISKTQLLKKCKEIATYYKRDNINRACWFVHEYVLEKFNLGNNKAPIPCKWKYATEVRKIQILIFPKVVRKSTPSTETTAAATPHQSPGANIAKFVSKVSPNVILEQSKLKHEKAKQVVITNTPCTTTVPVVPSITKYTTEKISPAIIIEKSAQRIAEDIAKAKLIQEQEAAKAAQIVQQNQSTSQDAKFIIPTHDDVKSFFRMNSKEKSEVLKNETNENCTNGE